MVEKSVPPDVGVEPDICVSEAIREALSTDPAKTLQAVVDALPNPVLVKDREHRWVLFNSAFCRVMQHRPQDIIGRTDLDVVPPEQAKAYAAMDREVLATGQPGFREEEVFTSDGERRLFQTTKRRFTLRSATGEDTFLLARFEDVTERREAERSAAEMAARLAEVLESTTDCVLVVDRDYRVTYMNTRARESLRERKVDVGTDLFACYPEEKGGRINEHYERAFSNQQPVSFEQYSIALGRWLEVHCFPAGEELSIFFRDITERRRAEEERLLAQARIVHMARHDALTELPNRLLFRERLERALADGRRPDQIAVLYLDLDGFKEVNDTLGHEAGDTVLKLVAQRLEGAIRRFDTVARFGGDEFAIIQTHLKRPSAAADLAERIIKEIGQPFDLEGRHVLIGASVGIAIAPPNVQDPEDLLRSADTALYRAKAEGRGTYRVFEPGMDDQLRQRQAIKLALHGALDRGEFELHYQPLVDLQTSRVRCLEGLLRWRQPERGLIAPAEFIGVAEDTGLIIPMGGWALEQACRDAADWPEDVGVAVNLSPIQFRSHDLIDTVDRALKNTGLTPRRLQLEITESVMLQNNHGNLRILGRLRQLGVQIALDDFGTGYSSLSYLQQFPFDKIKVDRAFVGDLPAGREARAIVRAVAGIAAGLGMSTTAEGVETIEQATALMEEGYREGQGFLFSAPVPAHQVKHLLGRDRLNDVISGVSTMAQPSRGAAEASSRHR